MRAGALAFLAGNLCLHSLSTLPGRWWGLGLAAVGLIMLFIPALRLPAWGAAGFLWTLLLTTPPSQLQLSAELEGRDLQVEGSIASIPRPQPRRTRFELAADSVRLGDVPLPFKGKLDLSWYELTAPLRAGDRWCLTVRLERPHGLANPGAADYERWLFAKGVAARGYVRPHPEPVLLQTAARYPVDQFRQGLIERFERLLSGNPFTGILTALAVGESHAISPWQWEIFTRTGTGHLLSISGLHISLVAGLLFVLVKQSWAWLPALGRRWPAPAEAAAVGALAGAGGYALLAGLSLPTQRALTMIAVAMLALLARRPIVASRILALALLAVLILDPAAPLTAGFWLSFGAVATILYLAVGRRSGWPLTRWLGLQGAILLAMLPASLILFQQIPLLSPLANLVAIPWTSVTVVPLTLLAVLAGWISETAQKELLHLAAMAMDGLWRVLVWLGDSPWALLARPAPPLWTLLVALPGLLLLLAPRGLPGRWLGGVLCLPLLFFPAAKPAPGGFWFTLLDAGQGLAAVVRTRHHVLIYDTGPRMGFGFDASRAALIPFLRQQGTDQIDVLIVSHGDSQHTGGVRSLLEAFPVRQILTADPVETPITAAEPCRRGQSWDWDGVGFHILHPPAPAGFSGDNRSCVLLVAGPGGRVLLPGDIEAAAEAELTQVYGAALAAQVLVAPHHGHRHHSLPGFLDAVQARYVLFSTGYNNRFGYPRPETVARYTQGGARILDTAQWGAITFRLDSAEAPLSPEGYRQQYRRYWHAPDNLNSP